MGSVTPRPADPRAPRDHVSRFDAVAVAFPRGGQDGDGAKPDRPLCSEGEDSLSLAVAAARNCLARSRRRAEDLGILISASVAHHPRHGRAFKVEPSLSFAVKESVGALGAVSLDLSHADAGMLMGVLLLDDFIARGAVRCGMVVSGECLSRLGPGERRRLRESHGREHSPAAVADAGAAVVMERSGDGRPGIAFAAFASPPLLGETLDAQGLRAEDFDWLISDATLEKTPSCLAGRPKNVVPGASLYGDSASATPFVTLVRGLAEGRFRRGDRVAMIAGAPDQIGVVLLVVDALGETHGHAH